MPLLKLFEIIENLLGFVSDEQPYHYKSDTTKRKLPETTDIRINCVNKTISPSSDPLLDSSIVSLLFVFHIYTYALDLGVSKEENERRLWAKITF